MIVLSEVTKRKDLGRRDHLSGKMKSLKGRDRRVRSGLLSQDWSSGADVEDKITSSGSWCTMSGIFLVFFALKSHPPAQPLDTSPFLFLLPHTKFPILRKEQPKSTTQILGSRWRQELKGD